MFFSAHLMAGLILGKLTGNYPLALIGAVIIDVDHLISYTKNKLIFNLKELWKTITNPEDPYGDQRNVFHSFVTWFFISLISLSISFNFGVILSLAYLSHLFLDMLDSADFFLFYPYSKFNIKGPVRYFSKQELIFTIFLFVLFILI